MNIKDELMDRVQMVLYKYPIDREEIKHQIQIILQDYRIERDEQGLVVYDTTSNEAMIQRFLVGKKLKGCSDRTIAYYNGELRKFARQIKRPLIQMTTDDIRLATAVRIQQGNVTNTTMNNTLRVISSFCTWMRDEEFRPDNPMSRVDMLKTKKQKKKAFTEEEIEILRDHLKNEKERCIFEILLSTGCRISELVGIRVDEINGDEILVHGKGDKDRIVYLNARAKRALENWLKIRATKKNAYHGWLFPTKSFVNPEQPRSNEHTGIGGVESFLRNLGRECGVNNVHPHRFRRTFASLALKRGMPIIYVSKLLGHESVDTTQIYLDINDDEMVMNHRKYVT